VSGGPRWALILGVSSGLGAASARALAAAGYGILGVHLDRRAALPAVNALVAELSAHGQPVRLWNENAADDARREVVLDELQAFLHAEGGRVEVYLHSLAFGTLKALAPADEPGANRRQLEMTLDVMAHSFVYWAQGLLSRGLLGEGGRILAFTSSGGRLVLPAYGPVSAAKAALEAYVRQLAVELAPRGVTVNAIEAGVTETPALAKIPGNAALIEKVRARNPHGRLTRPDDVAACLVDLVRPGTRWMTGNIIRVDGGEGVTV
jgi:enoyl-[acyl-carrier protein] reductase III